MLLIFLIGAGVSFYKGISDSKWADEGIQGLKDGCSKMGLDSAFCECYASEITARISPKEFNELHKNIGRSETDTKKAKNFIDPIIAYCSESVGK